MIKQSLREALLNIRIDLNDGALSKAKETIITKIKKSEYYKKSKVIGIYAPIKNEIDLMSLLDDESKVFALPVVTKEGLKYFEVTKNTTYKLSDFGILEPSGTKEVTDLLELMYIPGIGFNSKGYRLGYGKGYYDKFLSVNKNITKIGIGYLYSIIDFEEEEHDISMDEVYAG